MNNISKKQYITSSLFALLGTWPAFSAETPDTVEKKKPHSYMSLSIIPEEAFATPEIALDKDKSNITVFLPQEEVSKKEIKETSSSPPQEKKEDFDLTSSSDTISDTSPVPDRTKGKEISDLTPPSDTAIDTLPVSDRIIREDILWLEREDICDAQILNIFKTPPYQGLHFLFLSGNPITDVSVKIITQNLRKLITLNLSETNITNEGVKEIALNLLELRDLNLSHIKIKQSGATGIGKHLTELEKLFLKSCQLSPHSCSKLTLGLPNIRTLNLAHNFCNHEGFHGLFIKPHSYLTSLNITFNGVRDLEILQLARSPWFNNLRELNLSHNDISDYSIGYIAKHLTLLKKLDLSRTGIRNKQAVLIADNLTNLQILKLRSNRLTEKSIIALASKGFPHLKMIDVSQNKIGEEGVKALEEMRARKKGNIYIYWG